MDSLVVLQISGEGIMDESMEDMIMGNLRVLDISFVMITRLPDLSRFPKLEIIDLKSCWTLEEIHSSIGGLRYLKLLNIAECHNLTRLPEELGSAKALQEIILLYCDGISELPDSIGGLGDLRILRWIGFKIRELPSSIVDLKSLEELELKNLYLHFGNPMLEVRNHSRCNLSGHSSLPSLHLPADLYKVVEFLWIEKLCGLQKLKLDGVGKLGPLSTKLGSMSMLEELSLHSRDISSALKPLRMLTLVACWQSMQSGTSQDNIGNMSYPVRLSDLGCLRGLYSLHLGAFECIDFSGIERMELLEELSVFECLDFVGEIADLSNLKRLKRVAFHSCDSLFSVPRMLGDCHLKIDHCIEFESFEGPY